MAVQAWFEPGDVNVTPGRSTVLPLTIVNLGNSTDSFAITPTGLASAWTVVRPGSVTLFGGAQQVVDVEVHPPALSSTTAGPAALSLRIVPQSDPDDVVSAETTIVISPVERRRIHLLQPVQRARHRATFELMIANEGNTQASCRLQLVDLTNRVHGDFDPPAAAIEPGGTTLVQLRVRTIHRRWRRPARSIPFVVTASQPGSESAEVDGVMVQTPLVGERFWSRLAAIALVVGALIAAWFAVVAPQIRDAADDAVADRLAVIDLPGTTVRPGGGPATPGTTTPGPVGDGTIFNNRLTTVATAGQTATQAFTVPEGSKLEVTDLIVEDPNDDDGTATVLRGDAVLFSWKLRDVFGVQPLQLVTPIELSPGQTLTFQVTCSALGDPASGSCSQALSVLGRLVPTS